ncbi:MAG: serine/threonine protein kinase, partial [Chloroflexi bacterium]|nr:serine/threonine protein kinase [Chloroflexota bacterium]
RRALDIAQRVADALAHAHSRDIIHRDVKPSNTMLTYDHSPRLTDFGIARLNYHQRVTLPHTVIGTTPYLSPEAVTGEAVDGRSDVWSLGVMLYEMLAGTLPFIGRSEEMFRQVILSGDLPDIRQVRPDVPDPVWEIIQRMLTRTVSQRMPSAAAARDALKNMLNGINTKTSPP